METPRHVNKRQLFSLIYKFMLENNIHREWFINSKEHKFYSISKEYPVKMYTVYGVTFCDDDDFKTHLEKCIDVYIYNINRYSGYGGCIYGFFRYIPSCFDYPYHEVNGKLSKWGRISEKWEDKYKHTIYLENEEHS